MALERAGGWERLCDHTEPRGSLSPPDPSWWLREQEAVKVPGFAPAAAGWEGVTMSHQSPA